MTAIIAKRYPYPTAYRLMQASLEKNVQEHRDSDAFSVGARLMIAFWLADLPHDLGWRATALARHRDLVQWLLPRIGLAPDEVARTAAHAAGFTPARAQRLITFVQALR